MAISKQLFWEKFGKDVARYERILRQEDLFNRDGSLSAVAYSLLTTANKIHILPNDILDVLKYAPAVQYPNLNVDPELAILVRSFLLQKGHIHANLLSDDAAVNLARDGFVPNAVLLGGNNTLGQEIVTPYETFIIRSAPRHHPDAQALLAELIEIPKKALGDTSKIDAADAADLLDIFAVVRAADARGQSIISADDMWADSDGSHSAPKQVSNIVEAAKLFVELGGEISTVKMVTTALWYKALVTGQIEPGITDINEFNAGLEGLVQSSESTARFDLSGIDDTDLAFNNVRDILAMIIYKGGDDIVGTGFTDQDFEAILEARASMGSSPMNRAGKELTGLGDTTDALRKIDFPYPSPFLDAKKTLLAIRELIESDFFNNTADTEEHQGIKQMSNYVLLKFLHGGDDLMRDLMQEVFPQKFRNSNKAISSMFKGLHTIEGESAPTEVLPDKPKKRKRKKKPKPEEPGTP